MANWGWQGGRPVRIAVRSRARPAPPSAFSAAFLQTFLARATRLEELPSSAPSALARGGSSGAAVWAGPWEVERVDGPHGRQWAVVRRGEPVAAGGRAVAMTRHRADAALLAASLPALAVPSRLRLAEKGKGASCVGLAVESLGAEELPILGRALMRRVEAGAA